ncbi:MAG TPA: DNA primase [Polyangiaceae bacterium]|nr:DNA primase [Polyangiaceae bacterium]
MIGQETLDRVRRDANIVEVVGESVKLQKRGRSHVGLCPFHKEKTPSFHVNPERGFYHCFGCHASGDAIKFVQETEGLEFVEAVRLLAERMGIDVIETSSEAERRQQTEARRRQQELFDVSTQAAAFFERMLREHPLKDLAEAELARRELVPAAPTDAVADALQAFRVGYAPFGWEELGKALRDAGVSLAAAEKVGLVAPRKSGSGYYDRFRNRLMFAVIDGQGRVIAFSGRALPEPPAERLRALGHEPSTSAEPPAKYMNSPESPIYKKREAVFGLYQARAALRETDRAVIVEGNFDVLSLHARGIKHVVAPLGTAFTVEQAKQIRRYTQNVTLLFDPDEAGRRATRAARDTCRDGGLTARVAKLPSGVDPDELARRGGAEQLTRVLDAAAPMIEHLIEELLDQRVEANDSATQAQRVQAVIALVASETDPTARALAETYADKLAGGLALGQPEIRTLAALKRHLATAAGRGPAPGPRSPQVQPPHRARSRDRREEVGLEILGALLDFPELFDAPETAEAAALLEGDVAAGLAALRQAREQGSSDPETVLAKLAAPIHPFALARTAAPKHERLVDAKAELVGNLRKLESLTWSKERSMKVEELQRAERTGDVDQEDMILRRLRDKARERHGL